MAPSPDIFQLQYCVKFSRTCPLYFSHLSSPHWNNETYNVWSVQIMNPFIIYFSSLIIIMPEGMIGIVVHSRCLADTRCSWYHFNPAGVSSNWSDDQPYSWSEAPYHPPTEHYKEASVCPQTDGTFGRNLVCPVEVKFQPGGSLPDLQSLDEAIKFLRAQPNASLPPFFLAVGFHKPHVPLKYPTKYRGKYNCICKCNLYSGRLGLILSPEASFLIWIFYGFLKQILG